MDRDAVSMRGTTLLQQKKSALWHQAMPQPITRLNGSSY
nr:MAG TPA: hypothetical protein [Caudoviricetes sp.]